jgi:hypothetical protein
VVLNRQIDIGMQEDRGFSFFDSQSIHFSISRLRMTCRGSQGLSKVNNSSSVPYSLIAAGALSAKPAQTLGSGFFELATYGLN